MNVTNWRQRPDEDAATGTKHLPVTPDDMGTVSKVERREYRTHSGLVQEMSWRTQFVQQKGFCAHAYDVVTPPCIFRRFTPNGRFLLAIDRGGLELLLFPYKRWRYELSEGTKAEPSRTAGTAGSEGASTFTTSSREADTFTDVFGDPLRLSIVNAYTTGILAQQRALALQTEAYGGEEWTHSPTYLRDLVLCTPCSRYILLGAWQVPPAPVPTAPVEAEMQPSRSSLQARDPSETRPYDGLERAPQPTGASREPGIQRQTEASVANLCSTAALPGCPIVPAVFLFLVDLQAERVTDVFTLRNDLVNLDGHTGVQLFGADLVLVTSLARQTVHLLRIRETTDGLGRNEGVFQRLASFGPHCYADDALLIAKQYRRERDFRRQGRRVFPFRLCDLQQAEDSCPESDTLEREDSMALGSADQASTPAATDPEECVSAMVFASGPASLERPLATPSERVPKRRRIRRRHSTDYDTERESSPFVMPCTTTAAIAGTAMAAAAFRMAYRALTKECFFTGMKQRLLAFLFRKYAQGNMRQYSRFAASFETLQTLVIQRAALVAEERVLLRMVPAAYALRAFSGSAAASLLQLPWYMSGVSVTGIMDSDLALVHATESRAQAATETLSPGPELAPIHPSVCSIPTSKRRTDPGTELMTQLRATLYVIYNYMNAEIEAAFPPGSTEFLALSLHHPEWLGLYSGVPVYRIERSLEKLRELKCDDGSVYCPLCLRRHRNNNAHSQGNAQKAEVSASDIFASTSATSNPDALSSNGLPSSRLEDTPRGTSCGVGPIQARSGLKSVTKLHAASHVVQSTMKNAHRGRFMEANTVADTAALYNEPLLATFLLLPLPCQPHSASPWLNRRTFSYDETKLWSRDLIHPAVCNENPTVRVFLRHKGALSWRMNPAEDQSIPTQQLHRQQRPIEIEASGMPPTLGPSTTTDRPGRQRSFATNEQHSDDSHRSSHTRVQDASARRYAAYIFHPNDAFCLSILWSSRRAPVVNLHFGV